MFYTPIQLHELQQLEVNVHEREVEVNFGPQHITLPVPTLIIDQFYSTIVSKLFHTMC